jgi:multicomponent Na+:H+ antiporter subunit B
MPSAINFDYRGFDTLGEEYIFFTSVTGLLFMLSGLRAKTETHENPVEHDDDNHRTGALRWFPTALAAFAGAMGMDLGAHGQLTPGGGFQGGVILAAGPLAVFLAGRYLRMKIVAPHTLVELGEAAGAVGYALVGLGGLIFVGVFFKNFLPLGATGHLLSAGQMDVASAAVGLEVSGAFLVAFSEFLDQAIAIQSDSSESEQ